MTIILWSLARTFFVVDDELAFEARYFLAYVKVISWSESEILTWTELERLVNHTIKVKQKEKDEYDKAMGKGKVS